MVPLDFIQLVYNFMSVWCSKMTLEALVEQVNRYPAFLIVHHSLSIVFINIMWLLCVNFVSGINYCIIF